MWEVYNRRSLFMIGRGMQMRICYAFRSMIKIGLNIDSKRLSTRLYFGSVVFLVAANL